MTDPIVDEVRRIRDAHAARFNYDLDLIFRDIKEQERLSGLKFVTFASSAEPSAIELPTTVSPPNPSAPVPVPMPARDS